MKELTKQERTALEAVARSFSATWKAGSDSADAYLTVDGKRVAAKLVTLRRCGVAQIRLRFDKVALRLIERLRVIAEETVPDGATVLLTVTAPIRLPAKTAASLEDKIQTLAGRGWAVRDQKDTIHGNGVRIRMSRNEGERAPKMIAFVHNADSDAILLLNMTSELLTVMGAEAGDWWLVLISAGGKSCLEVYRYIFSQLRIGSGFEKIFLVSGDRRAAIMAIGEV